MAFARAESEVEMMYLWLVAEQAIEVQKNQRIDTANRIVVGVASLFGVKTRTS